MSNDPYQLLRIKMRQVNDVEGARILFRAAYRLSQREMLDKLAEVKSSFEVNHVG